MQNKSISSVARTKDGIAVPKVVRTTRSLSGHLFLVSADIDPKIIPKIVAITTAEIPRRADTPNLD